MKVFSNQMLIAFSVLILTCFITCQKDLLTDAQEDCLDEMVFSCSGEPLGEIYFKGKINGTDFCVAAGIDGYLIDNLLGTSGVAYPSANGSVSYDPSIATGYFYQFNLRPEVLTAPDGRLYYAGERYPVIQIRSPVVPDSTISENELLDVLMQVGDIPLATTNNPLENKGFDLAIRWECDVIGIGRFRGLTQTGLSVHPRRKDNYTFKIVEYEKVDLGTFYAYKIKMQIECDLFDGNKHKYGRLTEGEFQTRFLLPK